MIKVKFYGTLQALLKTKEMSIPYFSEMDVKQLLIILQEKIKIDFKKKLVDNDGKIIPGTIILVNKQNIFHLNLLETQLNENDEVVIFPPGAGG
ncbi:MoaD/ThiS family protein [Deferribacterales bacterium Es71-Z0220]|uniref:MoaD/ThiS family protein n=1 Tax=Deferrivibrio essentukiensis TaxID=2880922 RepID=UPI001F601607|nr:MoaD/ThiS family protein [Deferrivibrio essentukiensis]MCB4203337.1 MoaD/ThiS family protein [Deferrivibrio essentukiensis]